MNKTIMNKTILKRAWHTALLNFRNIKIAYILPLAVFAALVIHIIVNFIIGQGSNPSIEVNTFFGVALLAAILIPARNFKRCVSLNVKKKDFFLGVLINYLILSAALSIIMIILYYSLARPLGRLAGYELTLYYVFGFSARNPIVGFLQQFGFIFFLCVFIHTFVNMQDKWPGWLTASIIAVLIPLCAAVPLLRTHVYGNLFRALIFGHPVLQILFTIVGGAALYFVNLPILKRKTL